MSLFGITGDRETVFDDNARPEGDLVVEIALSCRALREHKGDHGDIQAVG